MFVFESDDYIGKKFGKLTVVEFKGRKEIKNNGKRKRFMQMFRCKCECGGERIVALQELQSGKATRCKKCKQSKLIGRVYGKLTVIDVVRKAHKDKATKKQWGALLKVRCACGNEVVVHASALTNKVSPKVSCGRC